MTEPDSLRESLLTQTAKIVSAHVRNNIVSSAELQGLISGVYGSLAGHSGANISADEKLMPVVSIRSSITPDYLVCLEDGMRLKMLKRHLWAYHGMTPSQYRAKWNLGLEYPMVAPRYAEKRKEIALDMGLGRMAMGRKLGSKNVTKN